MDKHLQFMEYEIAGNEDFFKHFCDKLGCKPVRNYDGEYMVLASPDFLYDYPERVVLIMPIKIICEEQEDLQGRKNIVYGIHLVRKVMNQTYDNSEYTSTAWNEYEGLISMYENKYGKAYILYDNNIPSQNDKHSILNGYINWNNTVGLTDEQKRDLRFLCECRYSKIAQFKNELGRIYVGQSYLNDELHIVYIDNEAEQIGKKEYYFNKLI